MVYGDYDVDGVCSTTVIVEFLRRVGAEVHSMQTDVLKVMVSTKTPYSILPPKQRFW